MMRKVAIMQPYLFPYIGYFQLVNEVEKFVFYDDVNYIKGGWINRNKILIGKSPLYFSVPLAKASPNALIKDTRIDSSAYQLWLKKFDKTLKMSFAKAPYFDETYQIILEILTESNIEYISELASLSVVKIADHLDLSTEFSHSSKEFRGTSDLERSERLIHISKSLKATHYINVIGGMELYDKDYFSGFSLHLLFLETNMNELPDDIGGYSIIQLLMNYGRKGVRQMLDFKRLL